MYENTSRDPGGWQEERDKLMRHVENFKRKALEMMSDNARLEEQKLTPKLISFEQNASGEYESPFKRLEREIDELKNDNVAKGAMIKDLQERLSKLEAMQNLAN